MSDEGNEPLIEGPGTGPLSFDLPRSPPGLREKILVLTSAAVRSRARWRRMRLAAALVAIYAAGFATAAPFLLGRARPPARVAEQPPTPGQAAPVPTDPEEIRRRVPDAPPSERARLLQLAGDLFEKRGDFTAALECYGQVLELASPPTLKSEPEDSWLLIALKQASRTEKGAIR
jgi:hypothetical protein